MIFPSDYLNTLLAMACAAEKEFLTPITSGKLDSLPFFIWHQEGFPYITHRFGETNLTEVSGDLDRRLYTLTGRIVVAHVTTGVYGENEKAFYRLMPAIESLYKQNVYLTSVAYPNALPEMGADPNTFTRDTMLRVIDNRGLSDDFPRQLGGEFSVTVEMMVDLERKY